MAPSATWLAAAALLLVAQLAVVARANEDGEGTVLFVRTQSIYPPYIDYDMSNRWWDFGGSTVVNTNRYIRLTPDLQGRKGWLRSKMPFVADSWSVEFEYKIHGKASSMAGDGMAFWVTRLKIEEQSHVLGGPETWDGVAITFDTYDNGRHGYTYPYVAALYNDGTRKYNKDTDGKELELAGCQADIRNRDYATRARVRFIKDKYLKVELNTRGWDDWTTCFTIQNVTLANPSFLSFTGETGGLSDNHDIISVSTNQILRDDSSNSHINPKQPDNFSNSFMAGESKGPSFFFVSMAILGIGAVAFFGLKMVNAQNKGPALPFGAAKKDYKHF